MSKEFEIEADIKISVIFDITATDADDAEKQAKEILEDFYRLKSSGRYTPCMSKVDILVGEYED